MHTSPSIQSCPILSSAPPRQSPYIHPYPATADTCGEALGSFSQRKHLLLAMLLPRTHSKPAHSKPPHRRAQRVLRGLDTFIQAGSQAGRQAVTQSVSRLVSRLVSRSVS
ncbi:uncharacterized protein EKO05_0010661 [Ascochyta rabiei]|uniref:uncharacterized protein n=1 Tax=Didymella rabiei TaxID=5454 RepID=UPI00220CFC55|nr:uncharacterized protein EKO05_0010661 [Ascochyta rabiei]UPX20430.1 hypothetical protein EKO05_0010661 [Ascochyta rabiei]